LEPNGDYMQKPIGVSRIRVFCCQKHVEKRYRDRAREKVANLPSRSSALK
jgi:hypothetical protein